MKESDRQLCASAVVELIRRAWRRDPEIEHVIPPDYRASLVEFGARFGVPAERLHDSCFARHPNVLGLEIPELDTSERQRALSFEISQYFAQKKEPAHSGMRVLLSNHDLNTMVKRRMEAQIPSFADLRIASRTTESEYLFCVDLGGDVLDVVLCIGKKGTRSILLQATLRNCPWHVLAPSFLLGILEIREPKNDDDIESCLAEHLACLSVLIAHLKSYFAANRYTNLLNS